MKIMTYKGIPTNGVSPHQQQFVNIAIIMLMLCTLFFTTARMFAQDNFIRDPQGITADEINAVAGQMYCLECENIPLDVCGTQACVQWREEIRYQLAEGKTDAEIIEYFRVNHGEQALSIPGDPILRNISTITPYALAFLSLLGVIALFFRWAQRGNNNLTVSHQPDVSPSNSTHADSYLSRIEQDIKNK